MTTRNPEIEEAIAAVEAGSREPRDLSLQQSIMQMGELYVTLKAMGVDKENILDLIRIPFMFASVPNKPEMVAETLADIDKVDRSN